MLEKLSIETLEAIFDTMPVDLTFVDNTDTVRYYSKGDSRIFKRTPAVIGKKVKDCHPQKSLHKVEQVIGELVEKGVQGLYVIKSTVPSGTTRRLTEKHGMHISHNPEFLREKTAKEDIIHPEIVVIGACCPTHAELLRAFYAGLGAPIIVSEPTTTETVKLSLNSYLATLITFWNEVDKVARQLGISTSEVAGIVKLDPRVSSYGTAFFGAPFGGKCLPKDLDQLIEVSRQSGADARMLEAVRDFNKSL